MAPAPITEDYYMVLEVVQTATPDQVIRSYKRLALKLHPDRNAKHDATEAFQRLGRAYETLNDESKRRAYDLIYPSITRSRPSPQATQSSRPPPASTPQSGALSEAAQIAALRKSKQERGTRWGPRKNVFDSSIFELQRDIRRLEQEIKNLDSIAAAETAEEAQKNSWGAWLLSPIYKKAEDSEKETERKDRERQERRIEKDMKERRLGLKQADLKKEESLFRKAKEEVDSADLVDDGKIRVIEQTIWTRETRERQEREKVERERQADIWKQQQDKWDRERQEREKVERERVAEIWKQQQEQQDKRNREAAEAPRRRQAEERAATQKQREEQARRWQKNFDDDHYAFTADEGTYQASKILCSHNGWWPKIQGRTACPECHEVWTYLLQCPGCKMNACPRCQSTIRPRWNGRAPPRARTSSEDHSYDYF